MKTERLFSSLKKNLPTSIALLLVLGAILVSLSYRVPSVQSANGAITGWAWSSNIGWISLSSTNASAGGGTYGLTLNVDQTITGYAWSNLGWIQFGSLSGFPAGSGTTASNAAVSGTNVVGWAKVLATNAAGNFDGWISLSGTGYGVTTATSPSYNSNFAWGSTAVGWVSFNAVIPTCTPYTPSTCTADHLRSTNGCIETICPAFYPCTDSSGQCGVPSDGAGNLSLDPDDSVTKATVRSGATPTLYWNISDVTSCTLNNTQGTNPITVTVTGGSAVGNSSTNAILQRTTYTLACTGPSGAVVPSSVIISIVPSIREI